MKNESQYKIQLRIKNLKNYSIYSVILVYFFSFHLICHFVIKKLLILFEIASFFGGACNF